MQLARNTAGLSTGLRGAVDNPGICEINHMDQFGHLITNHRQCQWHLLYLQLIKRKVKNNGS